MKMTHAITIASTVLLAVGCAHEERSARTNETVSPGYGYSAPANGTYSSSPARDSGTSSLTGSTSESDNSIVAQVRENLQNDPEIAFVVPNIQITANNGAIILSGSVQSEEQKRQILSRVQKVAGVVTVNNQLNVISGASLNPTGMGPDRLYRDAADGQDRSTNNALTPTSRDDGPSQLYHDSNQGEQNSNSSTNGFSPTSQDSGGGHIYQSNPGENSQGQDSNSMNPQTP